MIAAMGSIWPPYTNHFVFDRIHGKRTTAHLCLSANLSLHLFTRSAAKNRRSNAQLLYRRASSDVIAGPISNRDFAPRDRKTTLEAWISERVLKLTCTAVDMLPLAEACNLRRQL